MPEWAERAFSMFHVGTTKTVDGRIATITATDAPGDRPIVGYLTSKKTNRPVARMWEEDGTAENPEESLANGGKILGWVNVYENDRVGTRVHKTEAEAEQKAGDDWVETLPIRRS